MPQPFKLRPGQAASGNDCMAQRQACAVGIATVMNEWAELEYAMANIFGGVAGSSKEVRSEWGGGYTTTPNAEMRAALMVVDNLHLRFLLIEASLISFPQEIRDDFAAIKSEVRARAEERNTIAHARWMTVETYPNDLLLSGENGEFMRYTAKDFANIVVRISAAHTKLYALAGKCARWKIARDKGAPQSP